MRKPNTIGLGEYELMDLISEVNERFENTDRFEVIDDNGRAYVKGGIYGTPVRIDLSIQDDDKTLKVFITRR